MNRPRVTSFSRGGALGALWVSTACAGCGGSGEIAAIDSGASGAEGGVLAEGGAPTLPGDGAACPATGQETVAIKVTTNVTWPPSLGFAGGAGPYVFWLLSRYAIDGQDHIASTMRFCRIVPPPAAAPDGCTAATSVPGPYTLGLASPVSEWTRVTKTTAATGVLGGLRGGSSISISPSVSLFGLKETSQYKSAATPWPPASPDPFGETPDYEDEEGDGTPGITLLSMEHVVNLSLEGPGYGKIPLSLAGGCGMAGPAADRVFEAIRIELSLYGTNKSCTEASGMADVPLIDSRIIGCSVESDGGLCTPSQAAFVDTLFPAYVPGPATFEQVVLAAGASATCDDVVAALPDPDAPPDPETPP